MNSEIQACLPSIQAAPEEWNSVLQKVVTSLRIRQSFHSVYLNSDHQVAVFASKSEAKQGGYNKKLTFKEILNITNALMERSSDENLKLHAAVNLRFLAIHKACRKEAGPSLRLLFKEKLTLDESLKIGMDLSPYLKSMVTPAQIKSILNFVENASGMVRSVSGDRGVYFFMSDRGNRLGIKMEHDPIKHVVADRYFRRMGFITPHYCAIRRDTVEGRAITEKLEQLGNTYFSKKAPHPLDKTRIGTFRSQLSNGVFFQGMEYLHAIPFRNVISNNILRDLHDPEFLKDLGEVMFLDAVIHNTDRMNPLSCNFGNIMRRRARDIQEGEKKIALLDHDFKLSEATLSNCKEGIEKLLRGNRAKEILLSFIKTLPDVVSKQLQQGLVDSMLPSIKKGVQRAASEFVKNFSDHATVIEMLDVPVIENMSRPDYRLFMELVSFTKKRIDQGNSAWNAKECAHQSAENQKRSLENLYNDLETLNEDMMDEMIPYYYANTGLKTRLIFLLIQMNKQLIGSIDEQLEKDFEQLRKDLLSYIQNRLSRLEKTNRLDEVMNARLQLEDMIFACKEIKALGLKSWCAEEAQSVADFRVDHLSDVIKILGLSPSEAEIQNAFKRLQEALEKSDLDALGDAMKTVQNVMHES